MKTLRFLTFAVLAVFLSGCYTQLAIEERRPERTYTYESYGDQEYTESDTIYYDEEEESDQVVNNYYILPGYKRYLWHYYPSTTIVVGSGFYFDYWVWDTWYPRWWYCDPWYPPVAYYPFWYYHPNYYYYGGYHWDNYYNPKTYKYRNDNISRVRNNDGGRGSSFSRRDAIQAYDRNRPTAREGVGTRETVGTREGVSTRNREVTRTGVSPQGRTGVTTDGTRGTVQERKRTNDPSNTGRAPEVRPRQRENDREPARERKPVYVPRERKKDTEKKAPARSNESERRRVVPNDDNSGRRSAPPSYNPPSNSGGSRQSTPPSRSGGSSGGSNRGGSNNETPRRSR